MKKPRKAQVGKNWDYLRTYKLMAYIVAPLLLIYVLLEDVLSLDISFYQKVILFYSSTLLILYLVLSKFEWFRKNFMIAHFGFLIGNTLISLFWYHNSPEVIPTASLLLVANLIGIGIIEPKTTIGFYVILIVSFFTIGAFHENYNIEIGLMLMITAAVVSGVNYSRAKLNENLIQARETFKGIFDASDHKIFVLDEKLNIIDASDSAEEYLLVQGLNDCIDLHFFTVFQPEDESQQKELEASILEAASGEQKIITASFKIKGTEKYYNQELTITRGKYFSDSVFLISLRVVHDQKVFEKELIEHKDNVTQILENINYFVFNISFDINDRFRHHVNYVSSKVEEVYGYTIDEYIARVKSEKIDEDRHPEDKDRINENFDHIIKTGGKGQWRFRMKVRGKWRWIEETIIVEREEGGTMISLLGMVKDITDEVRAEQMLIDSEKRYRQIFENNLAGVYRTHVDGTLIDCNLAFAKLLGFDSIEEIRKYPMQNIYYNAGIRDQYIKDLKEKKQLNNYPITLKRQDGRKLIVHNNVSIQPDENGEENIILGTLIDLTELHETSIALKHSEEKYRMLFEESNNALLLAVVTSEENYIIDANQMATKLFGMEENDLIGLQIEEMLVNAEMAKSDIKSIMEAINKGDKLEIEWEFKRQDEGSFYAEVSFAAVVVDEDRVAQMVIKDISERKQYEKEILESRLSFKNIVDKSPASILIFSEKGELAYVNPNGEDLFLNVLNSKDRHLYRVFPEDKHFLIDDLIREAENDINSYTEIELGQGDNAKKYSINVVNTIYNFEKANLFILQDITLQTEYNIQKLRAEMAEETNISLQEEIKRHKRTQRSLMESTSRLKALFESAAHLFILSIDWEFNVVSFNQNFKKMVKDLLDVDVQIGMNFLEIFPIEDYAYDIIKNRLNGVLAGEPSNLVSKFKSLKGEVWMESFMSPISVDGQEVKEISFISHDITEQVENRKKILQSEENNRALLLAVPDVLMKANKSGVFTDYRATSDSHKSIFNRFTNTDDIQGKKIREVVPDSKVAADIEKNIKEALEHDKVVTHNFSALTEDGEKIHFENRYSKINDEEVVIISRNVTSTVEYEEKLIESVKEKEVLLKEVHHRVKNNLQVINSILNLQSSYVKDDETLQIIIESQNRIRSMSYIHESLYQTKDFASINFKDYITNLVQNLIHSYEVYSDQTELDLQVEQVELALDQAIPCGLILNELITNSLKYAYPNKEGGKITIGVKEEKGKVFIKVQDFGVGLPKGFNISESDTLGLSLVDTLIDQLDGELQLETESGTEFLIIFEKQAI